MKASTRVNITASAITFVLSSLLAYGIGLTGGWFVGTCVFLTYNSIQAWLWMPRRWREYVGKICEKPQERP